MTGAEKVLPLWRVVKIERLGATVWQRLDGSVDAGLSYASSSELLTIDLAARVTLNRPGHGLSLDGSSTITRQPDADETSRNNLTFSYRRRRPGHWAEFAQAQAEQNTELGFDLRASLTAGAGRYLLQGRRHDLLAVLGLRVNREKPLEGESTNNLEAALGFSFDRFRYDFPKVDVYATVSGFASLTDWGRDARGARRADQARDPPRLHRLPARLRELRQPADHRGRREERLRRQLRPRLDLLRRPSRAAVPASWHDCPQAGIPSRSARQHAAGRISPNSCCTGHLRPLAGGRRPLAPALLKVQS